uniref:Protein disulfide-isomerase n=1 Tax=Kalanchoe fedtschenkoi TaxID=63787 RepID=A0A7N0TUS9_KALFE
MPPVISSGSFLLSLAVSAFLILSSASAEKEYVLTLDQSNFTDVVSKHDFIVVEFYAPWCGHCKSLAPEYEKAANTLSSHNPPLVLAKVNAVEESNKALGEKFEIQGFPTIKILRNGGKISQEYKGPRDADGIVAYLIKQLGPASVEIKSADDAKNLIGDKKVAIVGIFPKFEGEEYQNFSTVADILRADYELGHTLDAKLLPHGDSSIKKATFRVFKPFDELVADSQNFDVEALQKFVEESTVPLVTVFDNDQSNHPYLNKYFNSPSDKAMLFVNFTDSLLDSFKSKLHELAAEQKGKGLIFLVGDVDASQNALDYFGVKAEQSPFIIVQTNANEKFLKTHVKPDELSPWLKEYLAGEVKPFIRSQPIPQTNDEPVKVVVTDSLEDFVLKSNKNVLLEFYAPWCGHCKKLAPILDEVATHFEKDPNVVIAKLDATENDVPQKTFAVEGFPTLYFKSSKGKITSYEGDRSKEDIIAFIEKERDDGSSATASISEVPSTSAPSNEEEAVNDEL